jgi:hypothetical protein
MQQANTPPQGYNKQTENLLSQLRIVKITSIMVLKNRISEEG